MGLDWIAKKKADGTPPQETLGMRRLSRDDECTMREFRKIVESYRDAVKARGATPGTPFYDKWMRPFDEIVDEAIADEDGPPFIASTAEVKPPSDLSGSFMCGAATSFRGKMISFTGVSEDTANRAYGGDDPDDEYVMTPSYALDYADELQGYVDDPGQLSEIDSWGGNGVSQEESVDILKEAIAFLRFWGTRGHPIWCWS